MERQLAPAPRQYTLSHTPQSAVVYCEEPNPITQPPCSADLALRNLWLFQRPANVIKCHCFISVQEIQQPFSQPCQKSCAMNALHNDMTAGAKAYVLKTSTWRVTQLCYMHILLYYILHLSSKTLWSSHLSILSYCTKICNFLPILEGTLSPPYFFLYNQKLWQSFHCICDGPHAYHRLEIVTMDRIYKIFRMTYLKHKANVHTAFLGNMHIADM